LRQRVQAMRLSKTATALLVALAATVLVVVLLTPVGFETRSPSALRPVGYAAIGTIFVGLGLFLAAIGLIIRKSSLGPSLAIVASALFFFPVIGDQAGYFFSLPIPPAIRILEFVLVVALVIDLSLSVMVYSEARTDSRPPSS
jgi:O-antigen ligase